MTFLFENYEFSFMQAHDLKRLSTNRQGIRVSCRILHNPICYDHNDEVVFLTCSERSHILY